MLPSYNLLDYPFPILVLAFFAFWTSAWVGAYLRKRRREPEKADDHEDFTLLLGSTLTLLALIIGFTFSMAVNRYDLRKNYEEQEANAIGTEYVRADLLPAADAARIRAMLMRYLDQRMLNYETRTENQVRQINTQTASLQTEMWSAVTTPGAEQQTPVMALVLSGMNDVLNSQGYTQAAWWNRVPTPAWILLITISIFCNLLIGYGSHRSSTFRFLILPIVLSISLFLIADIDSPRGGVIRVQPQNLEALSKSLHPR
jgi:lipopolysaccharide export LptBFGC system permease protein LptF